MRRIGIAASKMAKGDLLKYNLFVVGISFLFSLLLLGASGFVVLAALFLIAPIHVIKTSLAALAVIIGLLALTAIIKNFKIRI